MEKKRQTEIVCIQVYRAISRRKIDVSPRNLQLDELIMTWCRCRCGRNLCGGSVRDQKAFILLACCRKRLVCSSRWNWLVSRISVQFLVFYFLSCAHSCKIMTIWEHACIHILSGKLSGVEFQHTFARDEYIYKYAPMHRCARIDIARRPDTTVTTRVYRSYLHYITEPIHFAFCRKTSHDED